MVTLAILAAAACSQTSYKPATNLYGFLCMRFYEPSGASMLENLQVLFPPKTADGMKIVLRSKDGKFREEKPAGIGFWPEYPAFANVGIINGPPTFQGGQPGDFVVELTIGGEVVGAMEYSVLMKESGDAFNPVKKFTRKGLWNKLGFFASSSKDPKSGLNFFHWTSLDELGATGRADVTLHVMNGAKEVAKTSYVVGNPGWNHFSGVPAKERNYPFTLDDFKTAGSWSVVLKHKGAAFRTYAFEVKGGKPVLPKESAPDYEPRTGFLAPRMILVRGSNPSMEDTFWVKAK